MHALASRLSHALLLTLVTACVTPTGTGPVAGGPLATTPETAKAGTKTNEPPAVVSSPGAANVPAVEPAPAAVEAPKVYTSQDLTAFLKTQAAVDAPFGPAEHELVGSLPKAPAMGSLEEAALALGLAKSVLFPLGKDQQTFIESDIEKAPGARTVPLSGSSLSLEGLAKDRDVNLADALVENPLLQGYGIAKTVFAAVTKPGNSPAFKTEITSALKTQANNWQMLGNELRLADQSAAVVPPQPEPSAVTPPAPGDAGLQPPDPAELHASDSVLGEAQALADRGDYKGAIKKAQAIDASSPLHNSAQEKVKEFSNRGVQDLRKKAAQAFQSAMPLNDKKTRAEYLKQAKGYLEDALTSYPQATQLPTVRDNLRVISRDLEQTQPQGG